MRHGFYVDMSSRLETLHRQPHVAKARQSDEGLLGDRHVNARRPGIVLQRELQLLALLVLLYVGEPTGQPGHGQEEGLLGGDLFIALTPVLPEDNFLRQEIVELAVSR